MSVGCTDLSFNGAKGRKGKERTGLGRRISRALWEECGFIRLGKVMVMKDWGDTHRVTKSTSMKLPSLSMFISLYYDTLSIGVILVRNRWSCYLNIQDQIGPRYFQIILICLRLGPCNGAFNSSIKLSMSLQFVFNISLSSTSPFSLCTEPKSKSRRTERNVPTDSSLALAHHYH